MQFKSEDAECAWEAWRLQNQDPYGASAVRFAHSWADVMEARVKGGLPVGGAGWNEAAWEELVECAMVEGTTQFQVAAAVGALSAWWTHGDPLLEWWDGFTGRATR